MRRGWVALYGAVLIGVLGFAPSALATNDFWFTGTLTPGFGYASTGAHSITYIQGSGNFNGFCIAKDQGISGYASASRVPAGTPSCATSGGFVARTENGSCCYHGWISNGTGNDLVVDSTTYYSY
jgi:hypothetical protein